VRGCDRLAHISYSPYYVSQTRPTGHLSLLHASARIYASTTRRDLPILDFATSLCRHTLLRSAPPICLFSSRMTISTTFPSGSHRPDLLVVSVCSASLPRKHQIPLTSYLATRSHVILRLPLPQPPPLFAMTDLRGPAKYTGGDPEDLESFLRQFIRHCTASPGPSLQGKYSECFASEGL
jgi:hypothetical protein